MKTLRLREGKERAALRRHPWIYDNAIAKGGGDSGETVRVESATGQFLGWAAFSPKIRARIWSFDEAERVDDAFFARRLHTAIAARARMDIDSDGVRLVHGEADGLPGLIVDRYGETLVAQFLSSGSERWKPAIADALCSATGVGRLYERSDSGVRALEGLQPQATRATPTLACANMPGNSAWMWPKATKRAFTSISATVGTSLPSMRSVWVLRRCSIAIATRGASASPP
jgi:23S rRNA (cytosine1962-C5)-methyltransferase